MKIHPQLCELFKSTSHYICYIFRYKEPILSDSLSNKIFLKSDFFNSTLIMLCCSSYYFLMAHYMSRTVLSTGIIYVNKADDVLPLGKFIYFDINPKFDMNSKQNKTPQENQVKYR